MQEFPQEMDGDAKASMIEDGVRRACPAPLSAEVDTKLHAHVRQQTRVWCSDGADLHVPLVVSWDEAHSAQRMAANSMGDVHEVVTTDRLLVTGKKRFSLAKFLTTSLTNNTRRTTHNT